MASFVLYDLVFLSLFIIAFVIFFFKRRSHFKKQGWLYLYHTSWGIKFIDKFTNKFARILKPLQYLVVLCGYFLMVSMVWFIAKFSYSYISSSELVRALKVPVVIPLIPYLPELFKIDFLPPFYFTYWIIIIALIAIPHEFAHGIFARLNKVKVHSTGFGFLGPFLAAFVEPDEKHMKQRGVFPQLSVLAGGTFANIIVAVLFGLILWAFFAASFTPEGINFNSYATSPLNISSVVAIGGIPLSNISASTFQTNESLINVTANNNTYFTSPSVAAYMLSNNFDYIVVYTNSPAFNSKLDGTILSIDDRSVKSYDELREILSSHKPGDNVTIITKSDDKIKEYNVSLGDNNGSAFLGIGAIPIQRKGLMSGIFSLISEIKDPNVAYVSRIGDIGIFIYDLLWWSVLISISVALVNMLPMGIFDGGRFFYLTILGITRNEKYAMNAFKWATYILLTVVILLMVKWVLAFFI